MGAYSGKAGDGLSGGTNMVEQWSASLDGMQFSTRDQDNDRYLQGSCAEENMGGWWYNRSAILQECFKVYIVEYIHRYEFIYFDS